MTKATATIRKDGFTPSRPWVIDLTFDDGSFWKSWSYGFRTKSAALEHCSCFSEITVAA